MTTEPQMPEGVVADSAGNWVDRIAPPITRPYLRLSRADRPIGTWLLYAPCLWALALAILANGQPDLKDLWLVIGAGLGAFLMRGAGCTWNDITDRHIDGSVERTRSRPIPSGQVSVRAALIWMVVQALLSLLILMTFPPIAIALGFAAIIPVAIYPFAKRFTWWPQAFLGIALNWGALLLWAAHAGSLGWAPVMLYAAGICWTLFYDTIYAHQDIEDDALIGVKSTARLFGDQTHKWLRGFMLATIGLMGISIIIAAQDRSLLAMVIALAGPWAMGWHLMWQMQRFANAKDGDLLQIFRSNRDAGLIPLPFFAIAAFL
ncbi:MAG: 4-hydroxybenzoate octaprenyltransferase [Yoonia sp.]